MGRRQAQISQRCQEAFPPGRRLWQPRLQARPPRQTTSQQRNVQNKAGQVTRNRRRTIGKDEIRLEETHWAFDLKLCCYFFLPLRCPSRSKHSIDSTAEKQFCPLSNDVYHLYFYPLACNTFLSTANKTYFSSKHHSVQAESDDTEERDLENDDHE